jgi:hypothetical protein
VLGDELADDAVEAGAGVEEPVDQQHHRSTGVAGVFDDVH